LTPPDVVERGLDVAQDLDHGPEEDHHADARDEAAARVLQELVGETDDLVGDLLLTLQPLEDQLLKEVLEAEPLGDAEGHGHDRHHGQEGVKGQGRGPQLALVLVEAAHREHHDPQRADVKRLAPGEVLRADAPQVPFQKLHGLLYHEPSLFTNAGPGARILRRGHPALKPVGAALTRLA